MCRLSTGCLRIVDSCLSLFVVSPLVVSYWRGTWQLLDLYLLPTRPHLSAWCSLAFGLVVTVTFGLAQSCLQRWLSSSRSDFVFCLGSRLYNTAFALACVNHWRGVWTVLHLYTGVELYSALCSVTLGVLGLVLVRGLRNVVATPCVLVTDHEKDYFVITTLFHTKENDKPYLFVLDMLFSVVFVASLVVFVWRGSWVLLDLLLYPNDPEHSAWGSCILGATISLVGFLLQWPASRISEKLTFWFRLAFEDLFILAVSFGAINVWRGVWNVLDIHLIPDDKELSNWLSHTIGLGALLISFTSSSILAKGVERDGDCLDGSGCLFPISYTQMFVQQRSTQKDRPKCDKRNWKKKDVEMANVNNTNTKLSKEEQARPVTESLMLESSETFPDGSLGVLRMIDSINSDNSA